MPHRLPLGVLAGAAAGSVALDAAVDAKGPPPMPLLAVLDWTAHVALTALVLRVLPARVAEPVARHAVVASVAIDADHIPIAAAVLRGDEIPRPRPHTFLTPLMLGAAGAASRGRRRRVLLGAALGVAAHLTRDLFNGPGVAAAWPLRAGDVRLPVAAEAAVVGGLLACAVARR